MAIRLPWPIKIAAKVVLSRLPVPYGIWSRLNLFKHGAMVDFRYASTTFETHFGRCGAAAGVGPFVCLELGPGDSLLTAVFARAAGSEKTYLVDAGAFAETDVAMYRDAARHLLSAAHTGPAMYPDRWTTVDAMLEDCRAVYLTKGLQSLRSIPTGEVDWSFSQAVLEHVLRNEFDDTIDELHRVTRPGGMSSHRIDLRDHLGGRLNSLRFSRAAWEGPLLSRSGFYTNRLRLSELVGSMERAGFDVRALVPDRWDTLPTPLSAMNPVFQKFPVEELRVRWVDVTLKKLD